MWKRLLELITSLAIFVMVCVLAVTAIVLFSYLLELFS